MHIVIVGGVASSLTNFRGDLIQTLVTAGARVTAMSAEGSDEEVSAIRALGAEFRSFPIERSRLNPRSDIGTCVALTKIFRELEPNIVLAYTIKPVVWSGVALRSSRTSLREVRFFALITGLGFAFEGSSTKRNIIRALVSWLYRASLRRARSVVFQNPDNRAVFVDAKIVPEHKTRIVNGSGVDLRRFAVAPLPEGNIKFLLIARLLGEKGVREFAEAASKVKQRHADVEFVLVGPNDPSPDGIPMELVEQWHADGIVRYCGSVTDVRPFIAECHVYVLPSYHEGVPRSVLEAMSMGRAILTTDVPGCRETVVAGENGWLVPKADVEALARSMEWFLANRQFLESMGQRSRQIAVERFDVDLVNAELLKIMGISGASNKRVGNCDDANV